MILGLIKLWHNSLAFLFPASCRFTPTCSQYCYEAVSRYGILKGSFLSVKRLARCRPGGGHGSDPVC